MTETLINGTADASDDPEAEAPAPTSEDMIVEDLLIEDVSIDGMCGVY